MKIKFGRDRTLNITKGLKKAQGRIVESEKSERGKCHPIRHVPDFPEHESAPLGLYHICTKGTARAILFRDDADYHKALDIAAISAYALDIDILAYCLMSNHVHFIVAVTDNDSPLKFINRFKQLYSSYFNDRYSAESGQSDMANVRPDISDGLLYDRQDKYMAEHYRFSDSRNVGGRAFKRVEATIKKIDSIPYLKNCIAYLMRNPVEAGLVKHPDAYMWSSYKCYFSRKSVYGDTYPVSAFRKRFLKDLLGTHMDVTASRFRITEAGNILPESFVDMALVEQVFDNSVDAMSRQIMKVNYYALEYDLAYPGKPRLADEVVYGIARKLALTWYGKELKDIAEKEKVRLIGTLKRRSNANVSQICRTLDLSPQMVTELFDM